ncbi:MAG: sigma-70 family RNA polymerase sigma factor [Phycisphaerales bacterium]|nr:MAG: sigma-70 family RNA polymerase sigma factor [Phycisphaerales bacterium]
MPEKRFEDLVDEYSRQVLNVALRVLGDPELAKDVHQEVFLAIWQRWHKYDGRVNWGAYLYKVTVRKAIDFARRARTGPVVEQGRWRPSTKNGPDEQLKREELQQKLTLCLAKLPKHQANVFVLSRIEGLKNESIAELLGCSPNTVRVHLHRAMKRLARELSSHLS